MSRFNQRRAREQRRRVILVILFLLFLAAFLSLLIYLMNQRKERTYPVDRIYDIHERNGAEALSEFNQQTIRGFASDLVTPEEDITPEGFTLQQEDCKAILFDLDQNRPVFCRNVYQKIYPASLAKIMTAILTMEMSGMNEIVTMTSSDFDLEEGAQTSALEPGDVVTMEQLFHLLVVYSSNDAAMAIARTLAGSEEEFVGLMNARARELGMTGTHFTNPTGLHEPDMYTTAYDVYLMMRCAYGFQHYLNVSQMAEYTTEVTGEDGMSRTIHHASTDQYLTNEHALPRGIRILASKTGTTDQAGSCLALIVQNEYGVPYIALVMGAWDKDNLYTNMTSLLNLSNA